MIFEAGDVVVVPFPFSDLAISKPRPALVVSSSVTNEPNGTTLLAMITSAGAGRHATDTPLGDLQAAGLLTPCFVRLKLFTLDNRLIARRLGALSANDRTAARQAVSRLMAL